VHPAIPHGECAISLFSSRGENVLFPALGKVIYRKNITFSRSYFSFPLSFFSSGCLFMEFSFVSFFTSFLFQMGHKSFARVL